ncbi:MAG: InlB B-repeat-containing protein, partial [Spirochaetales bacterium]|nr:InlB B-repeat-containing protein [Spirochaetales bacterium]
TWKAVSEKDSDGYYNRSVSYSNQLEIRFDRTVYELTFYTNNGTNQLVTGKVAYGTSLEAYASQNPGQRTGYYFIGWFSDIDGRSLYDFRCPITQDTQIYGRFISRRSPISAPRMQTIIRKHQTADVSADMLGIDSSSDVTLTAYQLSIDAVSGTLFASVMGYAPQTSDDSTAPVGDISVWQAIAFCNKLSIRAGRTPCYNVEGIDDWIGVPFCDIPMNADTAWETLTTDMSADGYRLPTAAELIYAEQHNNSDKDTDKTDDSADYKTTSVTIALPAEQRLLSKDKVIPPWRRQIGAILRLARTIK